MARGKDPGDDFDAQYNESRRRGQEKARRGESHWADDKYLERNNERLSSAPAGHSGNKSCAEKTVVLAAFLGGIAWAGAEIASKVVL